MKQRRLLKLQIIRAWDHVIALDYREKWIMSERSLQASFWAALRKLLQKNRRVFIEPFLRVDGRRVIPDLAICNSRSVIAVIELKYLPRGRPRYKKDIRNLALLAKHRSDVEMTAEARFRGVGRREKIYPIAKHVLFVWAGVHGTAEKLPSQLFSNGHPQLDECFIELHAATSNVGPTEVFYRD